MPPIRQSLVTAVSALGVEILIESDDALIASRVRDAWRDAACEFTDVDLPTVTVSFAPGADVHAAGVDEILHNLSPAVTRAAIAARAGELVMLHAAALANPATGAAAVLVAPSGTGKTTAASTLGKTFAYLTDETSGITADGEVLAYRKPLSVIETGHFKTQLAPSELGMLVGPASGRLAAIFVLRREPDHEGHPEIVLMDTVDALAELAPQVSFLGGLEHPLKRLAHLLKLVGGAHHVTYREAADLQTVIARALDRVAP